MKLTGKNILLISPESWGHIFVSKHHYAIELAKRGNKVFFLNPPSKTWSIEKTGYENVYSVQYTGFIKGLRFFPSFLQRAFMKKVLTKLEGLCRVKFDVVWSFDNSVFFDFKIFKKSVVTIAHIVDLSQDFEFSKATKSAKYNFSNTNYVLSKQKSLNPYSYFVNHGFYQEGNEIPTFSLPNKTAINVGYAGNLDIPYLDWELMKTLVAENRNVCFNFAGPSKNKDLISWMERTNNVFHFGVLDKNQLYGFYQAVDILIIAYKAEEYPEQLANSHKLMEYLGSGSPIVSNFMKDCEELKTEGLISMSLSNKEYTSLFITTVENLSYWKSDELKKRRIAYALKNSYEKQVDRIEDFINNAQ